MQNLRCCALPDFAVLVFSSRVEHPFIKVGSKQYAYVAKPMSPFVQSCMQQQYSFRGWWMGANKNCLMELDLCADYYGTRLLYNRSKSHVSTRDMLTIVAIKTNLKYLGWSKRLSDKKYLRTRIMHTMITSGMSTVARKWDFRNLKKQGRTEELLLLLPLTASCMLKFIRSQACAEITESCSRRKSLTGAQISQVSEGPDVPAPGKAAAEQSSGDRREREHPKKHT